MAPIGRVRGFGVFDRAMPKGGDVHVPLARAVDPLGNPALRTARSRKVQKGEDTSFETLDATWVARRVDGAPVGAGDGPTANTRVTDGDVAVRFSAFGLFDGHGGKACAEHCAATMLDRIVRALDAPGPVPAGADADDAFEARLPAALRDAFAACDAEFLAKDVHSGATATVVVVHGRCVTTASVGDSLAVLDLGVTTGAAAPAARLSPEHRLDTSAAERERIVAAGGEVRATAFEDGQPVGPLRVWPGGLAVSRTVGDRDGKKGGVVSEPEVSRVVVPDEQPGFRITLASDGLWDAVTVKQAAQCAGRLATAAAAAALCKRAQKQKDNRDDITVLVVDALADPAHKDPFQEKPPWKVAFKVKWPLRGAPGKEPVLDDPVEVPPPSARARWRLEAGAREAAAAAAAAAEAKGEAGKKRAGPGAAAGGGPGGRCAVCVVQKKGRCGTDTAPARCLRRGGRGRADALEDPFDDASEPPDEPFLATDLSTSKAGSEVKAEGVAPGPSAASPAPARRPPPPTPLPAASTAAIASMRAAERREKRRVAAAARRDAREKGAEKGVDASLEPFLASSSSSSSESESESEPVSAAAELANLSAALDGDPALRAAAPRDEVEGETLALQYELMWQQQANRHVITSLLGRVLDAADEEGERFAKAEGELAEAAAYMSKTREVRRILKREKRDADQRLALERAAAAAAASSRVGAQRRDADGNVIAPAHGADGTPEDAAAAAAVAAQNAGFGRALGVGPGGSPKTAAAAAAAAAAHAARYGVYHGRSPSGRPRIPKHVQDRFAGGVRIGSANALRLGLPAGDAGGVPGAPGNPPGALPGVTMAGGAHLPADFIGSPPGAGGFFPGVPTAAPAPSTSNSPPAAAPFSPSRFGPPEVLVDTIHAAAAHAEPQKPGGRGSASLGAKAAEKLKLADALLECAVCAGTAEASKCQETLRCSRCALPAHPRCYGVKSVAAALAACAGREGKEKEGKTLNPKGWLCWVCRDACDRGKANTPAVAAAAATTPAGAPRPSLEEKLAMFRGVSCVLCPVQLGAFKQCADGRWCHVACAQWMPEISVDEADVCRAIRGVQQIPKERARHPCVACGRAGGVSMRCSFGHCQVSFHLLCARRAGFHVRASDGSKTNHRAYCDKHSPAMAERDRARGVAGPAMPTLPRTAVGFPGGFPIGFPSRAPTSSAGADGSRRGDERESAPRAHPGSADPGHAGFAGLPGAPLGSIVAATRALRASALAAESTASLEATASALRRARLELTKGLALCRAVLRRETVKRAVARAGADVARARFGGAPITETPVAPERERFGVSNELTARAPTPSPGPSVETSPGPSGVAPVAPKRARSRATRGKPRTPKPDPDGGGEKEDERGRAKRARRSGSGGSVLRDGGTADVSSRGWSFP